MTPLLSVLEIADPKIYTLIVVILASQAMLQHRRISLLEHQVQVLRRQQNGEEVISPEVKTMAKDPKKQIAAMVLHRKQNPRMTIADAKWDIKNLS